MKLSFSTKDVNRPSFLELCRLAYDYGCAGFELYDAPAERLSHTDSILRTEKAPDARRWLYNRNLEIAALSCPEAVGEGADSALFTRYIALAHGAGIEKVIFHIDVLPEDAVLHALLDPAIQYAEKTGVTILLESAGPLADTTLCAK